MRSVHRGLALLVLLLFGAIVGGCGSASHDGGTTTTHSGGTTTTPTLEGGLAIQPPKPAPPLALRNYTGQPVDLSAFRGKAVLVTFVYTHCPDVCPLIVSSLAAAQRQLGAEARRLQIIAVTVDPTNDTPLAVKHFLAERGATGRMDYLIGTRKQLLPVWKAWGVAVTVNKYEDAEAHTAVVFGITPSGKIAVAYPSSFTPATIVHDVPLLARG
jgi:protein SCO1/2